MALRSGAGQNSGSVATRFSSWSVKSNRGPDTMPVGSRSIEPVSDFWVERMASRYGEFGCITVFGRARRFHSPWIKPGDWLEAR